MIILFLYSFNYESITGQNYVSYPDAYYAERILNNPKWSMALNLEFKDLETFQAADRRPTFMGALKNHTWDMQVSLKDTRAGTIDFNTLSLPHLQILQMNWKTASENITIHGHDALSRTIGISFQLSGGMQTRFEGVKHPLNMSAGRHNLVFAPVAGERHQMSTNAEVGALQMNLDEEFFKSCIGAENRWSDEILRKLEQGIPFSAAKDSAPITLQMRQFIDSIVNCNVVGPMRNLLIQSRALELLALQFEQLQMADRKTTDITSEDIEKLHQVKVYLDGNFLAETSLTAISRKFLVNEFKLKRGFKLLFSYTVFGYIRKLRMEYAVFLLRDAKLSVDQIAYDLGYEYGHHFSAAFKKFYGVSPSAYLSKKS